MEFDTALLLVMTGCALCWYIWTGIRDHRDDLRDLEHKRMERQKRAERLKKLYGRSE
jgi:hypothetical protein